MVGLLCGATALGALPAETLAGSMSAAPPSAVGLSAPTDAVHDRRHYRSYRRIYYYPRRHYHRYRYYPAHRYGYDPGGAIFVGAALGLMGAGIAAATAPRWGFGWGDGWGPYRSRLARRQSDSDGAMWRFHLAPSRII